MAVQITIRGVPEEVRDKLAVRAALQRQPMQEFLRGELERIAARPSVEMRLQRVSDRKTADETRVPASEILRARDHDRAITDVDGGRYCQNPCQPGRAAA